jgi:hypothetical protein
MGLPCIASVTTVNRKVGEAKSGGFRDESLDACGFDLLLGGRTVRGLEVIEQCWSVTTAFGVKSTKLEGVMAGIGLGFEF